MNCLLIVVFSQVYLSTRRGAWILNRVGENGIPVDMVWNRFVYMLRGVLPLSVVNRLGEQQLNQRFNHALYNLKPKHRYVKFVFFLYSYCLGSHLLQCDTLECTIEQQQIVEPHAERNIHSCSTTK